MATLINLKTKEKVSLRVNHTFGRHPETNMTALRSLAASRSHATIFWDSESWKIKDASSNGTYINGQRITGGKFCDLVVGDKIQFGHLPSEIWEVLDVNPPMTGLLPLSDNLKFIPLHDVHILPIEPQIMLHLSDSGRWMCEVNSESTELRTGDKVGWGDSLWEFVDARAEIAAQTMEMAPSPSNLQFIFSASTNEEHVSLRLVVNNETYELGERNHHYLLLVLARHRLKDNEKELNPADQGWVNKEVLTQMIGLSEQHVNIQIYRFRKQVIETIPNPELHQVIERRPGEVRFAYTSVLIEGGFVSEKNM